jgi:predicted DCC family thiol-disulfide oxidoreductase YuxK
VRRLTVLYDARCGLCSTARHWIEAQPQLVPLELLPAGGDEARRRLPTLAGPDPEELIVVSDEGDVYRGPEAWIVCLWALADYRRWSYRLARPSLLPLARSVVEWISSRRYGLSRSLGFLSDEQIAAEATAARRKGPPGACAITPRPGG